MVSEQGEMVGRYVYYFCGVRTAVHLLSSRRIDADIENVNFNIEQGENQLLEYLRRISSDRWTMIKSFAIIIFFFVLFIALK